MVDLLGKATHVVADDGQTGPHRLERHERYPSHRAGHGDRVGRGVISSAQRIRSRRRRGR